LVIYFTGEVGELKGWPIYQKIQQLKENCSCNNWISHQFGPVIKTLVYSLYSLTHGEIDAREQRASERRMNQAQFPFIKTVDDFEFAYQAGITKRSCQVTLGFKNEKSPLITKRF
jgi:DNA replication protein DnaC